MTLCRKDKGCLEVTTYDAQHMRNLEKEQQTQKELKRLLIHEEQSSSNNWLQLGNKNTVYFHHKATSKKRRNLIKCLKSAQENLVTSDEDIGQVLLTHFQ